MDNTLAFEPATIRLQQSVCRTRRQDEDEVKGYSIAFRSGEVRIQEDYSIAQVTVEGIAQERSDEADESTYADMSVSTDDDSTVSEVECVYEVSIIPSGSEIFEDLTDDALESISQAAVDVAYPYIRERLTRMSSEVFVQPLELPVLPKFSD